MEFRKRRIMADIALATKSGALIFGGIQLATSPKVYGATERMLMNEQDAAPMLRQFRCFKNLIICFLA